MHGWCVIEVEGRRAPEWVDIDDPRVVAGPFESHDEAFACTTVKGTGTLWVLGAETPEMERVEKTLRESGAILAYAIDPDRERIRFVDDQPVGISMPVVASDFDRIMLVACRLPESIASHRRPEVVIFKRTRPGELVDEIRRHL